MSHIIVLFNSFLCENFDRLVELKELGNVHNHNMQVWGDLAFFVLLSFAV